MINFIQTNQNNNNNCKVITNTEIERIHKMFYNPESNNNTLLSEFYNICDEFQISERAVVKLFLNSYFVHNLVSFRTWLRRCMQFLTQRSIYQQLTKTRWLESAQT